MRNAIERLRAAVSEANGNKAAAAAMANLAEAVNGLVQEMRADDRGWVDSQAERHREIKDLLRINAARREVVSSIPSPAGSSV